MGTLQRVKQETVSSENLTNAIENMNSTRTDAARSRLRLQDGERLYPKNWLGSTPLGRFAREVAAWLGCVDPKHGPEKLIQQITKGTLKATEAWTDGRHAIDDKYLELDVDHHQRNYGRRRTSTNGTWETLVRTMRRLRRVIRTRATTCHTMRCVRSQGKVQSRQGSTQERTASGAWHRG